MIQKKIKRMMILVNHRGQLKLHLLRSAKKTRKSILAHLRLHNVILVVEPKMASRSKEAVKVVKSCVMISILGAEFYIRDLPSTNFQESKFHIGQY